MTNALGVTRTLEALRRIVLLVAVVVVVMSGSSATPAAADCSAPTIDYEAGPVQRGQRVTVMGRAFGYECHDAGAPPPGEGVLGLPISDVEIVVFQDPVEIVVARGAADADYAFEVQVSVPPDLAPGEARLFARWGDGGNRAADSTWEPLIVSDEPPLVSTLDVEDFGPAPSAQTAPLLGDDPEVLVQSNGGGSPWPFVIAAVAVVAIVGLVAIGRRRSTRPSGQSLH